MFLISVLFVLVSSYLIGSSILKNSKNNIGIIVITLIAFAQIVLSFEVLSLLKLISKNGLFICNTIFFIVSVIIFALTKATLYKPNLICETKKIHNALKKDKLLGLLSICFIVFIASKLFEILVFPVNFGDALGYYIPRCTSWIQNGSIAHFITPDTRELIMPVNMEFLYCWILLFFKNDNGIGIFSFISFIGALYVIYNLLGELGFCRRKRIWSCFVFSSFALIAGMAKDPCADLFIGSLLLTSIYLFLSFIRKGDKIALYFSTLSIALAVGTKTTAIIAFPSVFAIMAIMLWIEKRELFKKTIVSFLALLFINFIIFSSYNYIQNFIHFGNFISCQEQFLMNKFRGGIKGYICNLIKYALTIFDFSGIDIPAYHKFLNDLQIKIMTLIGETPASYTSKRFLGFVAFNPAYNTMNAALGAMGLFALLPCLCKTLFQKLSNKHLLLNLLAISLIVNVLVFSRVMVFTRFNLRYLVTFVVIAAPIVVFSYIKSNKNLYKLLLTILMSLYLFLLPHQKPMSYIVSYNMLMKKNPNIENAKEILLKISREEKQIFKYFISKEPCKIALMILNNEIALSDIEKLKLHGFQIDKILSENLEEYDLEQYNYIITEPYKTTSTNIQHSEAQHCVYLDNDMNNTTDKKLMASVECFVPFWLFEKAGFKKVQNMKFTSLVILEK